MNQIAIIGTGCIFPDADNPEKYWQNLVDKKDSTTPLSTQETEIDVSYYYHPKRGENDKISYNKNGHIRGFHFDPDGYHIDSKELASLDAIFHYTLYAAKQALNDSRCSLSAMDPDLCGLILGNLITATHAGKKLYSSFYMSIVEPYIKKLIQNEQFKFASQWERTRYSPYNATTSSFPATVASQALGLQGPCFSIDAACASALYVIKLASYYLFTGKADLMLAGAVCRPDHTVVGSGFNSLYAIPEKGECLPFDKRSEGLKIGEGAGFFVLKRYEDAVRNNNRIYAVVESVGLSNDGGAKHILVPDMNGQMLAIRRAYKGIPKHVDYIECHATGTPVGDTVEISAIEQFFSDTDFLPLIGANKGNVGHLLTASGMPSLIKVVKAVEKGMIPATISIKDPVETKLKKITAENIVMENIPWPGKTDGRRAGINAFGFGGSNAHIVLTEDTDKTRSSIKPASQQWKEEPLAIVGMGACFGPIIGLYEFNKMVYENNQLFSDLPDTRWTGLDKRGDILKLYGSTMSDIPKGSYVEKVICDCIRLKLPPNTVGLQILAHVAMMQMARGALMDAGYELKKEMRNVAVIIGAEVDFNCYRFQERIEVSWQVRKALEQSGIRMKEENILILEKIMKQAIFPEPFLEAITGGIGNIVASRISADWKFNGPTFCLSSNENSVYKAIEVAQFLFTFDEIEAVVIGAGDFAGNLEHILWRNEISPVNKGEPGFSYDKKSSGWNVGEGAGILVLKRYEDAKKNKDKVYSVIKSMSINQENGFNNLRFVPQGEEIAKTAQQALAKADLTPNEIGYVELYASGIPEEDEAEIEGLSSVYTRKNGGEMKCVAGSIKANIGHTFIASGMASIVKTALCLNNRYLPPTPGWEKLKHPELWNKAQFSVQSEPTSWDVTVPEKKRLAAINSMGIDRSYVHLILQGPETEESKELVELRLEDYEEEKKKALLKTIYVGREKSVEEFILSEENKKKFAPVIEKPEPAKEKKAPILEKITPVVEPIVAKRESPEKVQKEMRRALQGEEKAPFVAASVASVDIREQKLQGVVRESEYGPDIIGIKKRAFIRNAQSHFTYLKTQEAFYQNLSQFLLNVESRPEIPAALGTVKDSSVLMEGFSGKEVVTRLEKPDTVQLHSSPSDNLTSQNTVLKKTPEKSFLHNLPESKPVEFLAFTAKPGIKTEAPKDTIAPASGPIQKKALFDEADLVEMTDGKISNVLGPEWEEVDSFPIRTRMPSPPFMFVSRIISMTCPKGEMKPSKLEWEYDIPVDAYYVSHGMVPAMVPIESSHALIVGLSYMGCDQKYKGQLRYRALDSKTIIYDALLKPGDTMRGEIIFKNFIQAGKNVLVYYEYNCYYKDTLLFTLAANSGFFTLKDMEKPRGVERPKELTDPTTQKKHFEPFLQCNKTSFDNADMEAIQDGDLNKAFGDGYSRILSPGLAAPDLKMVDRIVNVDPKGGVWGLGEILAEYDVHTDHWAFRAHFKNDPVFPGTLISQGFDQLMIFYSYYLGFHTQLQLRPAVLSGHSFRARFRGEVKCGNSTLQFRLTIKDIVKKTLPESNEVSELAMYSVIEILYKGLIIGVCSDMGIRFVHKDS